MKVSQILFICNLASFIQLLLLQKCNIALGNENDAAEDDQNDIFEGEDQGQSFDLNDAPGIYNSHSIDSPHRKLNKRSHQCSDQGNDAKRNDLSNKQRQQGYAALLESSRDGKLSRATTTIVADLFSINRRVVQRI